MSTYDDDGITAIPDEDNLFHWKVTIKGPAGTVYEGSEYNLSLQFSTRYTVVPPRDSRPSSSDQPQSSTDVFHRSAVKRLQQEVVIMSTYDDDGITAIPDEDNLFHWKVTIKGPAGTVYEGSEYNLSLQFSTRYTVVPPRDSRPSSSDQPQSSTDVFHRSAVKRLQQEVVIMSTYDDDGITAIPDEDNLFHWKVTIKGPAGTVYEGSEYNLSLQFSTRYTVVPPRPNVSSPLNGYAADFWRDQERYRRVRQSLEDYHKSRSTPPRFEDGGT
ncbi:hypothetical protein V5799_000511 [Amblyomma americanum]|uniref:UBC core domain-containing protein n=1 Tax=Amblyomma americanum TaxID=6943 RepID=A0AAQ4D2U7_AMBAM